VNVPGTHGGTGEGPEQVDRAGGPRVTPVADATRSVPTLLAAVVAALDAVDDHVVILDPQGRVVHANVAWQRFALNNGWENPRWVGMDYLGAGVPRVDGSEDSVTAGIRSVLEGRRERYVAEYDCHAPDELRWFNMRVTRIAVPGVGAVVTHTDVTHRRLAERALEHRATHDELTGLANRASVQQSVAEMLRAGQVVGILSVRLEVAAGAGAQLQDPAIREAAHLLQELFPAPAVTARYAHDRLVVAAAGMTDEGLSLSETIVRTALRDRLWDDHGVDVSIVASHTADDHAARAALGETQSEG
jgi:GGDEF domain-containing protein